MAQNLFKGSIYDARPVYDWNNFELGKVTGARMDSNSSIRELIVDLNDDARQKLGARDQKLEIPMDFVHGVRRDEVTLDRSLAEIARLQHAAPPQ